MASPTLFRWFCGWKGPSIVHNEMGVTLQGGPLVLLARLTWRTILHNSTHSPAQRKRKTKNWGQHYSQRIKAQVELKSNIPITAIITISLKGFTSRAKAEEKSNKFHLPFYGPRLAPRQLKDARQLGRPICNPGGANVAAIK